MAGFGYYAISVIWDGAGNVELWFYDYLSAPEDWALIAESTDGPTGETTGKIISLELVGGATGDTTDALQLGVVHYIL